MKKYLVPLGVFITGNLAVLIGFAFFPALRTTSVQLGTDTADIADTFWGWSWIMTPGVVPLLVFIMAELLILYGTAKIFLAVKDNY